MSEKRREGRGRREDGEAEVGERDGDEGTIKETRTKCDTK